MGILTVRITLGGTEGSLQEASPHKVDTVVNHAAILS